MDQLNGEIDINTKKPLQIFTMAHAVRPRKQSSGVHVTSTSHQLSTVNCNQPHITSIQMKEVPKIKNKVINQRQPRSHLPARMIVSGMASRKRVENPEETQDALQNVDLSIFRTLKMPPPSWRSKLSTTRRRQPSQLEKMINHMKEKCGEFDPRVQPGPNIFTERQKHSELQSLISDLECQYTDVMNTPRLQYNYDQLYGSYHSSKTLPLVEGVEDPLGPESEDCNVDEQRHINSEQFRNTNSTEFQSSKSEFVWDPVIVPSPMIKTDLSPLLNSTSTNYEQQTCLNSPCSYRNSDSLSVSSGSTVAEERLQFIHKIRKKRQSSFDNTNRSMRVSSCWPSPESSEDSWGSWNDNRSSSFLKFLEE